MPVPLIVLTNGRRDCINEAVPSVIQRLSGWSDIWIVNDSTDPAYAAWLDTRFPSGEFGQVVHLKGKHGYWRAMRAVWSLARGSGADAVMFWEDDFVLHDPLDADELANVLKDRPYLTQLALLRQPWWPNEIEHGGLIEALEQQGQTFTERTDGEHAWIEHRACFTGNPSLIPSRTFTQDWPEGDWSEARFGRALFAADPDARGAYWGKRSDPPRVEHIGHQRVGTGY